MIIDDSVHGTAVVDEPVLIELVESAAMQRLRGVRMGGIVAVLGLSPPTTRFEHSLGVMLLVRRLGAGIEEQAAALLHDVSHTAFSHVIDYLFDRALAQDYHDDEKANYVRQTDIPAICDRHRLDLAAVLDETRYPLLEQPPPRLCADRADYTLRDLAPLGVAPPEDAASLLTRVTAVDGRMAFTDTKSARRFADAYMACATRSWGNPRHSALYELCARALRQAFDAGLVSRDDLWGSDDHLWAKLQDAARRRRSMAEVIDRLVARADVVPASRADADLSARTKVRWIDPEVAVDGAIVPLSALSTDYADAIAAYRRLTPEIVHLRLA